jgi:ChrR Cupin-like domain
MPVQPPPDRLDSELAVMLAEPFAQSCVQADNGDAAAHALRDRVLRQLAASSEAAACMFTTRCGQGPRIGLANGVTAQTLYRAQRTTALRPGEPLRAVLIELAPGGVWPDGATQVPGLHANELHREWLVLSGSVQLGGPTLSQRDYHVRPAGHPAAAWRSPHGACLFLRESAPDAGDRSLPFTVLDAEAGWPEYAPGIRRRVLWRRGAQAAMLYYAQPGAKVPRHVHGHDEECLMVQGDLFLDDVLLQSGDYQLAPAGTRHRSTETDTGAVIYAHGDLDLQFDV